MNRLAWFICSECACAMFAVLKCFCNAGKYVNITTMRFVRMFEYELIGTQQFQTTWLKTVNIHLNHLLLFASVLNPAFYNRN